MKLITLLGAAIITLSAAACQAQPTKGSVQPITESEFLTKVANYKTSPDSWNFLGKKPAIVDFYATWCGPCKQIAPILEELSSEYAGKIDIYKVDTDKEPNLAAAFGIKSIPSILFIPVDGKPIMVTGAQSKAEFKKTIEAELLKK